MKNKFLSNPLLLLIYSFIIIVIFLSIYYYFLCNNRQNRLYKFCETIEFFNNQNNFSSTVESATKLINKIKQAKNIVDVAAKNKKKNIFQTNAIKAIENDVSSTLTLIDNMKANAITMVSSSPSYGNFAMTAGAAATFALNAKNNFVYASEEFNKDKFDEASKFLTKALDEATKASEKVTQASNFATAPAAPAADAKAPADAKAAADAKSASPAASVTDYEKDYNNALKKLSTIQPSFENIAEYETEIKKIGAGKDGTNNITCSQDIVDKCTTDLAYMSSKKNNCCDCNNLKSNMANNCMPYKNSAAGRIFYYGMTKEDPYNFKY